MKITHYCNSFIVIEIGETRLGCDPWVGISSYGGWMTYPITKGGKEILNDTSNETLNETSEEKNKFNIPTNKIITKVLQRGAIKLCRKWGMHRAVMMFFSNQIRRIKQIEDSLEEVIPGTRYMDIINKTATKFLTKAEYLKQGQVLCGPCVVVNNLA